MLARGSVAVVIAAIFVSHSLELSAVIFFKWLKESSLCSGQIKAVARSALDLINY